MHLILALLLGCSGDGTDTDTDGVTDDGPPPPDPSLPPEVRLGVGIQEFTEVQEGTEVEIVLGPQGGFHIEGALQAVGIDGGNREDLADPSNPHTAFRVFHLGARVDVGIEFTQGLDIGVTDDGSVWQVLGRRVILDIRSDDELEGQDLLFEVEITDADGVVVTDAHTVVGVPHPLNP